MTKALYVKVMKTHGFHPTEEELQDMIRNVDTNANGAIDFNEFIEMMVKRDSRKRIQNLISVFNFISLCVHILKKYV